MNTSPSTSPLPTSYNLNLSTDYLPNWGGWEVAREIISNALDADPDYQINYPSPDVLEVVTKTIPQIEELFIIGHGSKTSDGKTIGQFGEGAKMAALVATRVGQIKAFLPTATITFHFEEQAQLGTKTLHAQITEAENTEEFRVEIIFPGISLITKGRILPNLESGPIPKTSKVEADIFCKGIYITSLKEDFIRSWNLNNLTLNRDRGMVDKSSVIYQISQWMSHTPNNLTVEMAKEIILSETCVEVQALYYADGYEHVREVILQAWKALYGDSLLATSEQATRIAISQGKKVKTINTPDLINSLTSAGVPLDTSVVSAETTYTKSKNQFPEAIAQLTKLNSIIGAPTINAITVYEVTQETIRGLADFSSQSIWLSEDLFHPDNSFELVRTYLHEVAHLMSSAADGTTAFESALDNINGKLGIFALKNL